MPVESSAVEIRINVVDANSAQAIGQVERNLTQMGNAGAAAGKMIGIAADGMAGHFATSLDKVRLVRQEFGLFMPRAMESMIARSQTLMGVLGSVQGAIVGIGAGLVAWSAVKEVIHGVEQLDEKFFSLSKAAQDYNAEVQKAKEEDFGNPHSVETLTLRLNEAVKSARALHDLAQMSHDVSWASAVAGLAGGNYSAAIQKSMTATYAEMAADQDRVADKLRKLNDLDLAHKRNLEEIDLRHAGDAELRGRARNDAQAAEKIERLKENQRYNNQVDSYLQNPLAADGGQAELDRQAAIVRKQADAENFNLERQQSIDIRHLREQALQADLHGVALYRVQEAAAIADLRDKDMDSVAARQAVHAKFHAEELKHLRDEEDQTAKMERAASAAGLTGFAKTQAEDANRIADINADQNLDPVFRARQIAAAQQQTQAEMIEEQRAFADRVDAIVDASADHQISGFARIAAEQKKQLDDLQRQFDQQYGKMDVFAPGGIEAYAAGAAQLDRGRSAINAGANQQSTDLARRNADETAQIEAEARAKMLSSEKQQTAAIEEQYEERLRKYQEQLQQQEISQDDFNRRIAAAGEERDAELVQSAREAREKIAGEMRGLFGAHPLQALQEMGSKYAAEAGAAMLQRVSGHFGGTQGPESAMDRLAGLPGFGRGRSGRGIAGSAAVGAMTIAQAQIYVTSAAIMGGGFGGGGYIPAGFGRHSFGGGGSSVGFGGGFGSGTSSTLSTGAPGIASPHVDNSGGGGFAGAINSVSTGIGDAKSIAGMIHPSAQALIDKAKLPAGLQTTNPDLGKTGHSLFGKDSAMSNTLGMAGAGLGLFSAFKTGGAGGMMSGAMSGAKLGLMLGGPMGAAIGAIGGFALGFFGGQEQARLYNERQVLPRIGNDTKGYDNGTMDYASAYGDLQSLETEARNATYKMGMVGQRYFTGTINPEIKRAMANLTREEKSGRQLAGGFSAAMFDVGADSVPRDGYAFIHERERIIPGDQNERITRAMESLSGSGSIPMQSSSGDTHLHVHAIDARGVEQFFNQNKHRMRSAINASFAENSGGADAAY